ncbi:neprilysin-11-like isoform X2 [Ornithodoros turicata]|uniref:neprilysin-11-like isoform X2 n=1 Tax=Ornithodoros turicata TaxID=34597 RepID=UPI003138BDB9
MGKKSGRASATTKKTKSKYKKPGVGSPEYDDLELQFDLHQVEAGRAERPHAEFGDIPNDQYAPGEKKSTSHIVSTSIMAAIMCAVVLFLTLYSYSSRRSLTPAEQLLCYDIQCRKAANYTYRNINPLYEPCNNFYEYVCSHWINKTGSFRQDTRDNFLRMVHRVFMSEEFQKPMPDGEHLLAILYRSCIAFMDEPRGSTAIIGRTLQQFQFLKRGDKDKVSIIQDLIDLSLYGGISTIFSIVFMSVESNELMHIKVTPPISTRVEPVSSRVSYNEYIRTVLQIALQTDDVASQHRDINEVDEQVHRRVKGNLETGLYTMKDVGDIIPGVTAHMWINVINRKITDDIARHKRTINSNVLITGMQQLQSVANYTMTVLTDMLIFKLYFMVRAAVEILRYDYFRQYEMQRSDDILDKCAQVTTELLPFVWPRLMEKRYNATITNAVRDMFHILRGRVPDYVQWMELPSRLAAIQKLKNVNIIIVNYPSMAADLDYVSLTIPGEFVLGYRRLAEIHAKITMKHPRTEKYLRLSKLVTDDQTHYIDEDAILYVPAAALIAPMFHLGLKEKAFNYGSFLTMMSVTVAAAVTGDGTLLRPDGARESWWTKGTWEAFRKHSACMVKQYNRVSPKHANNTDVFLQQLFMWSHGIKIQRDTPTSQRARSNSTGPAFLPAYLPADMQF